MVVTVASKSDKLGRFIEDRLNYVERRYHRLVLLVGPSSSGKTRVLKRLYKVNPERYIYLNLSLELSTRLKDVVKSDRPFKVRDLLEEIISETSGEVLLVDNIEVLFDPELKLKPLNCLRSLSRLRTIVATWNGSYDDGFLTYAEPWHREYQRCKIEDVEIIDLTQDRL